MAGLRWVAVAALLALGLAPTAQATPAVVAENVRHVANVPGTTGGHSVAEGDRLYVGAYGLGMRIFDIADRTNPVEIGRYMPGPKSASDPGLRADAVPDAAVFDGRHIAVLNGTGRTAGTRQSEFLDVTDPAKPVLLHRFTGLPDGEAHNGDIVDARRLWLPSGGSGDNQLRIYDLNPLLAETPAAPAKVFSADLRKLWDASPNRRGREVGPPSGTGVHDIEVYVDHPVEVTRDVDGDGTAERVTEPRDIALVAEGGSYLGNGNTGSIYVVDISAPAAPVVLNRWLHPTGPEHHPIRYFHEVQFLDGDRSVMVVTDEDLHNGCEAGGVTSVRVSADLTEATELAEYFNGTGTPAANCSAHVISTNGPYVFVGSYNAGLQVIDMTDPAAPKRGGQYIAPGANSWGALYYDGYVYVGDFGYRGLDVFEFLPDPDAEGLVVGNPGATRVSGVNETLCENGQSGPTVDGLRVPIPEEARNGFSTIRAVGDGARPYDLNVYFHDANCAFMAGTSLNSEARDAEGFIPEGAAFAFVTNVLPGPLYAYATITPGEEPVDPVGESG
jgi:hypothetical protein